MADFEVVGEPPVLPRLTDKQPVMPAQLAEILGIDLSPSRIVVIDAAALAAMTEWVARSRSVFQTRRLRWDDPTYWNTDATPAERSQFFAVGNAINFRFWRLEAGRVLPSGGVLRGERLHGAMYMWRALRLCLEENRRPILNASFLASLSAADFDAVFADDHGYNPLTPAGDDRIRNLQDLGGVLQRDWQGSFFGLVRAAHGSLVAFAQLSRRLRAFDDPLHKLTMVNAILHSGSGVASFDAAPLPGIDYHLLKQVLRHGVLRPNSELLKKLTTGQVLSSHEAYELRRTALRAFVEASRSTGVGGEELDNVWWGNKRNCTDKRPVCEDATRRQECPFEPFCARLTAIGLPLEETRYY
jgi:hypothetical protein